MKKPKTEDAKDRRIKQLEAQLRQLEQTREEQVDDLLDRLRTSMSDVAELLVRCNGYKVEAGYDD